MDTGGVSGDLDLITAAAPDVRKGKVIVDKDGDALTGTMPEQGSSTIVPGTVNKTAVAAGRYVTGNVIVSGDPNLVPANIKKNSVIFGIKGTFEGWVPVATDLYYMGNNILPVSSDTIGVTFQNTRIFNSGQSVTWSVDFDKVIDVRSFSKLNIQGVFNADVDQYTKGVRVLLSIGGKTYSQTDFVGGQTQLISVDISQLITINAGDYFVIQKLLRYAEHYITRIWLS